MKGDNNQIEIRGITLENIIPPDDILSDEEGEE